MNYIEHLLILISTVTGFVFIPNFASSFGIAIAIKSSAIGLKICAITAGYNSIIKKKEKHHKKLL